VDRQYQEAVSLYVRLINIINKLEEGDSDTSTGLLLDPHIIRAISSYRSVLEGQLERALSLLARETNATSVLNAILASLENITSQSDRLNEAITSAGLSAEESERFVADSRRILSGLGNTVRFIEQSLSESEVLLMSVGDFYNRTAENLDMLMDLSEIINTTSHEQFTHAREILSRANEALDRAIRAYVMLCNAWDLQNATLDTLSQIDVVELEEKLRRASASFKDAKADVPLVLQNALTILRNLQAIPVSDFGISSFRSQLDSLLYRHNDTTADSAVLDAENIALYTEAQSLKIQADHLYNWSKRLDLLARELLARVHVARATARRGYELGQSSINETELLLNLTKEKLREVEEFQSKLRSLLSLLRTARNWTYSALNESKASQELVSLIETIIADGISTIGNAVVLSESALMRAFDANTLATETLVNTNKLRQRSQKLKNQTEDTDARLESVDQRVTEDSRTIADLNTTAVMLETFGQEVAQRLKAVTARVDDLSMQYDRIPFVGAMEIDSLNEDITAAEELVEEIERDLKELRVRQGRLNKSTEEMEGKYELLKHHRQLLRKIRDSVKDLDCEGGS
jgi:DNA repair exonuclease SbcCD ATPase subunit